MEATSKQIKMMAQRFVSSICPEDISGNDAGKNNIRVLCEAFGNALLKDYYLVKKRKAINQEF